MFLLYEDTLYDGEKHSAILGRADDDEEYIQFLQPCSERLESQKAHDDALETIFERVEDLSIRYTSVDYELKNNQ